MSTNIITDDCLNAMRNMPENSMSAIVTDPPYGLSFMGKGWDHAVPGIEYWKECLRVSKPGAHLLSMGGTRTYHRLACAIEDAGYEIRDCIMWIYGSGFPKSHNHFGIPGYGTALKPAYEPIIMAMKPLDGTYKQNAEKWGQAGINVDGCRVATEDSLARLNHVASTFNHKNTTPFVDNSKDKGRWPANVLFDEQAAEMLDEQSGILSSGKINPYKRSTRDHYSGSFPDVTGSFLPSKGGASRFFYCAKASSSERNEGLSSLESKETHRFGKGIGEGKDPNAPSIDKNNHPTVKPIKLMEYLIKMVMPPSGGLLLDPFAGSGTTILAAKRLGFDAIGIEKSEEYSKIARARIENYVG